MIHVTELAAQAALQFGLSLRDDPTAWPEGQDTPLDVVLARCNEEASTNAKTAARRALGALAETVATAIDVAVHEDGALADADAVLRAHVQALAVDLRPVIAAAKWQDRVDLLRTAFAASADAVKVAPLEPEAVLAYLDSDPRFDGAMVLKRAVASPAPVVEPFNAEAETPDAWADEPVDEWADPEAKTANRKPRRARNHAGNAPLPAGRVQSFPLLLMAAGVSKAEIARTVGLSDSYISYVFSGKKPWPGLRPEQLAAVRTLLSDRAVAMAEAIAMTETDQLLLPD